MPLPVAYVAVVRDADEVSEYQLVYAGFLLYFAQGCHTDLFSRVLMPLGEIPQAVSADEQEVSSPVRYKSATGVDLHEFRAYPSVGAFDVVGRYEYFCEGFRRFEQAYQGGNVHIGTDIV